jgi:hypothetical protein
MFFVKCKEVTAKESIPTRDLSEAGDTGIETLHNKAAVED